MNEHHLINIANAGLELIYTDDSETLLSILLDIEDILDKGRRLSDSPETKAEINTKMDAVRDRTRNILDGMDKNEAQEFLRRRGEMLKNQFSI